MVIGNKFFGIFILIVLSLFVVSAQDSDTTAEISDLDEEESVAIADEVLEVEQEVETEAAGTDPSSSFYGLDLFFDNMRYRFSSDKGRAGIKISSERLQEAVERAENGDLDGLKRAIEKHKEILAKLNERMLEGEFSTREKILLESAISAQNSRIDSLLLELEEFAQQDVLGSLDDLRESNQEFNTPVRGYKEKFISRFEEKEGFTKSRLVTDSLNQRESAKLHAEILPGKGKTIVTFKYEFAQKGTIDNELDSSELIAQLQETIEKLSANTKDSLKIQTANIENSLTREKFVERVEEQRIRADSVKTISADVVDDNSERDNPLGKNKLVIEIRKDENRYESKISAVFRTVIDSTEESEIIDKTSVWLSRFTTDVLESIAEKNIEIEDNASDDSDSDGDDDSEDSDDSTDDSEDSVDDSEDDSEETDDSSSNSGSSNED